jgi:thiol-disulfide isomerase/thioredoxin
MVFPSSLFSQNNLIYYLDKITNSIDEHNDIYFNIELRIKKQYDFDTINLKGEGNAQTAKGDTLFNQYYNYKFSIGSDSLYFVYNGDKSCVIVSNTKTVYRFDFHNYSMAEKGIRDVQKREFIINESLINFSLLNIKNYLKSIENDSSINFWAKDTVLNDSKVYYLKFSKTNSSLYVSDIIDECPSYYSSLEIFVNASDYLPVTIRLTNESDECALNPQYVNTLYEFKYSYKTKSDFIAYKIEKTNYHNIIDIAPYCLIYEKSNKTAANWKLPYLNSNDSIELNKMISDVYILYAFTSIWCKPCTEAIPYLNKLENKYSKNLTYIQIYEQDDRWSTLEQIIEHTRKQELKGKVLVDKDGAVRNQHIGKGYPLYYLIDKDGYIRCELIGFNLSAFSELDNFLFRHL